MQTAEQVNEISEVTLAAVEHQGRQLEQLHQEYDDVQKDAHKSKRSLGWFSKCFLCKGCTSSPEPASPRPPRSGERKPAEPASMRARAAAREKLASPRADTGAKVGAPPPHMIGNGIDGAVGDALRAETKVQDEVLEKVDSALDAIRLNAMVCSSRHCEGGCCHSFRSQNDVVPVGFVLLQRLETESSVMCAGNARESGSTRQGSHGGAEP